MKFFSSYIWYSGKFLRAIVSILFVVIFLKSIVFVTISHTMKFNTMILTMYLWAHVVISLWVVVCKSCFNCSVPVYHYQREVPIVFLTCGNMFRKSGIACSYHICGSANFNLFTKFWKSQRLCPSKFLS